MAHFAKLDQNNIVIWVTPVDNSCMLDENGIEREELGIQHLYNTIPDAEQYKWKQTSYNNNFRVRYAGLGYTYDESLDAFIPPKLYDSWILDSTSLSWKPPIPRPSDGNQYDWNEETQSWDPRG